MIIFNVFAIPVVIIIGIVAAGVNYFFPFIDTKYEMLGFGSITFVVGYLCEWIGLKGRLFYIPIWLIGLGVAGYAGYTHWGWIGIAAAGGAVVVGFLLLIVLARIVENIEWKKAPDKLHQARMQATQSDKEGMWANLASAFFYPYTLDLTVEMVRHDRSVLDIVKEHLHGSDNARENAREYFERFLELLNEKSTRTFRKPEASETVEKKIEKDEAELEGLAEFITGLLTLKGDSDTALESFRQAQNEKDDTDEKKNKDEKNDKDDKRDKGEKGD